MDSLFRSLTRIAVGATLLSAASAARTMDAPTGVLTLREALSAAARNNPELAAAALGVRAGDGRLQQAGLLPNPTLSAAGENLGVAAGDSGAEPTQATLRVAQLVELGGKRAERQRLAALERDGSQWDYEVRRATVLAETAQRFVAVLSLQERRSLADDLVRLAEQSSHAVDAQVRAGAGAPFESGRARVALGQAQLSAAQREQDLAAARAALAASWAADRATFERVSGDLTDIGPPPAIDLDAVSRNPDVARWTTELDARSAALRLERSRAVPDVTVSAGPRVFTDSGQVAAVVELGLPLPLFDRNQGNVAAASAALAVAAEQQRAATTAVRTALARSIESMRATYARAVALRDDLIPAAHATFTDAQQAYRRGALRYLEVLDAQRNWFELRDAYLAALADYHAARIEMQRLLGDDLEAAAAGGTG